MKEKQKPKYNMAQCVGYMVRTAWRTRPFVLGSVLLMAALSLAANLAGLFVAPVILQKVEQAAPLTELLGVIACFTLILLALGWLSTYMKQRAMFARIEVRTAVIMDIDGKSSTTAYANRLDPAFTRLEAKMEKATCDNSSATEYIWTRLSTLLSTLAGFGLYLLILRKLDPFLMAVVIVTTAASFLTALHFSNWGYRHREEQARQDKRMSYLRKKSESVALAKDIRIFGLEPWLVQLYDSALGVYRAFLNRKALGYILGYSADAALALARNGIAYVYLIRLTLNKGLPASQLLLYFTAVTGFTAWITSILEEVIEIYRQCLDISGVLEYLNWPEPFRFEGGRPLPELSQGCELRLEGVAYRYPGAEKDIIRGVDLTVRPGEKLAVVGLNGAGKTTLVKLVCGFLDPTAGRVLLNGVDIRAFNRREYYALFSAVFQEFSVLDVSVAENVAQSAQNVDRERVADCLQKAGLSGMVAALPQGMDTHVGRKVWLDGVEFSGGQTQRLMLARALYKDGAILMLDEPTAALDPLAESDIYNKYNEMTAGKTSVFISHRLASTRFCDRVIFMADGKIAEEGTHDELLAQGGGYASLFEVQSRYYREGRDF